MNTIYEHNLIIVNTRHRELMRAAEHARLVRTVRRSRKGQPNRFVRMMRTMPQAVANAAQRLQHRNARQASGHAQ